ncbi:MAG: twin-arginine translocation pathway signal protein [Pseudomonadota bacterium]
MLRASSIAAALMLALLSGCAEGPSAAPTDAPAVEAGAGVGDEAAPATAAASDNVFVPPEFEPPVRVETAEFTVVPLGPELVTIDYEAYMASIEHLQKTFTRSTGWPREGITDADAMQDMLNEQQRFQNRESFAYAVLTADGTRERGCVYVSPSDRGDYDAVVRLWVTQAEYDAGFDAELYAWVQAWVASTWPFANVAYPGRAVSWAQWDALAPPA